MLSQGAVNVNLLGNAARIHFAASMDQKLHLEVGNGELK